MCRELGREGMEEGEYFFFQPDKQNKQKAKQGQNNNKTKTTKQTTTYQIRGNFQGGVGCKERDIRKDNKASQN